MLLLLACLGGMDVPAKRDWRGKLKTRASSLAGSLFFRRPSRPATASKPLFIRAHPCHPWFIVSLQLRSARSLLTHFIMLRTNFFNHGWHGLTRMGRLGSVTTPSLLGWHGCSREVGLARKLKTRASSLARSLFFRRPIRPATASKSPFICAHPCHLWFIVSLSFYRKALRTLVGDAFDLKSGMLEIEKQSGFQARDVEIAKHLGDVGFIEIGNHFWIDNDSLVYNQVGDEGANELTVVMNGKLFLLFADKTFPSEFDDQCALVELFIKTRLEVIEHAHGSTDDDSRELFVVVKHFF